MIAPTDAGQHTMELTPEQIRQILEALDASNWDEAVITVGDVRIAVARNGASLPVADDPASSAPRRAGASAAGIAAVTSPAQDPVTGAAPAARAAVPAAPAPVTDTAAADRTLVVTAPSVGVFWRSPEPGAPPFADVGQKVSKGDTMGIVEVMKLMSHVDAPASGTVTEIHVENAAPVEYGAALFTLLLDED
jgi:acetyl-CoA carboxylase biotin carboxyl carrier protein